MMQNGWTRKPLLWLINIHFFQFKWIKAKIRIIIWMHGLASHINQWNKKNMTNKINWILKHSIDNNNLLIKHLLLFNECTHSWSKITCTKDSTREVNLMNKKSCFILFFWYISMWWCKHIFHRAKKNREITKNAVVSFLSVRWKQQKLGLHQSILTTSRGEFVAASK